MQNSSLKVKMFGTFTMEYQGQMVSVERNERTRTNQLLQCLICNPNGIEREKLWRAMFEHENVTDPSNSLRALLFRLRKCLKEQGIPGDEYVHIRKRTYFFEPDCPIECDVYQFEQAIESADNATDDNERLHFLETACELYTGEFLPGLGAAEWAVVLNIKYKKMYSNCVKELCEEYRKRKEYKNMLAISEKAASVYPFDGWQCYQMEALIALNCSKEAILLYENTEKLLFEELGVALPQRMIDMMGELGKQVRNKTNLMDDVLSQLNEAGEEQELQGAYECTYLKFLECYHLISRMIERTGQSAWLILYTVTDGKGYALNAGERLEQLQEDLCISIRKTLRKGDMYTRYSDNQYLILLLELKQEDCKKVVERINTNLKNVNQQKYYTYHIAPVTVAKRTDKKEHTLTFMNAWRDDDNDSR